MEVLGVHIAWLVAHKNIQYIQYWYWKSDNHLKIYMTINSRNANLDLPVNNYAALMAKHHRSVTWVIESQS